jgi:hypothetical protein
MIAGNVKTQPLETIKQKTPGKISLEGVLFVEEFIVLFVHKDPSLGTGAGKNGGDGAQ